MIHGLLALAAVGGAPEVAVEPTAGPPWVEMVWSWTTDLDPAAQTGRTSAAAEVLFARADALSDLAGTVAVDARHGRIVLTAGAPADRWPTILPMLAERLFAASVSEQEANAALARAQRIRRATRYDDVALARQAVRADLFGGTLLARPAVGTARGLAAITEDDLASFLRRTFTRDRVRLDLRGPISRKFTWPGANLPTGTAPPPPTMPPPQKGTRLILVDKPSARSAIVGVGRWPVEGVPAVCQLGIRVEAMGHQRTFAWRRTTPTALADAAEALLALLNAPADAGCQADRAAATGRAPAASSETAVQTQVVVIVTEVGASLGQAVARRLGIDGVSILPYDRLSRPQTSPSTTRR